MLKGSTAEIPYDDIDCEISELIRQMNEIDGIETTSSCCGHGKKPCTICFTVENPEILNKLLFHCFNHECFWEICADTGDPHRNWKDLHFVLVSRDICEQGVFDNLANRIKSRISDMKLSDNEWLGLS